MLLVSPERLNNPGFRDEVLPRLAATAGLLVVDEAHCISDWGHDFRPDYRRIRTLLADLPDRHPGAGHHRHRQRPGHRRRRRAARAPTTLVLRGSLDRESLRLGVVRLQTAEQRLAWLADHLAEQPGSGIVYCLTVAATQEIADYLRSRGHDVAAYSGQTEPTERQALEQDLLAGRVKALVATSALGMGFDATLGFVVHLGRAALAGRLLPAGRPRRPWLGRRPARDRGAAAGDRGPRHLGLLRLARVPARGARPADARRARASEGRPLCTAALETRVELSRTRLETMLKVLDVDGAVRRVGRLGGDRPDVGLRRGALRAGRRGPRARAAGDARLPRHRPLPDAVPARAARRPGRHDCGRCDNCGGLALSTERLGRGGRGGRCPAGPARVVVEPRKMWPTALANLGIDLKGKIADGAEEGRAVARLTDLG